MTKQDPSPNPEPPADATESAAPRRRGPIRWIRDNLGLVVAVLVAIIGGTIWFYEEVVEERWIATRWAAVVPGEIYRSGQIPHPIVRSHLAEHGIERVINLNSYSPEDRDHKAEREAVQALGIEVDRFPMPGDGLGSVEKYVGALTALRRAEKAGERTLVHCSAGSYRAGATVAAYRVLFQGWSVDRALREMRSFGVDNDDRLPGYFREKLPIIAQKLKEKGVLDAIPEAVKARLDKPADAKSRPGSGAGAGSGAGKAESTSNESGDVSGKGEAAEAVSEKTSG